MYKLKEIFNESELVDDYVDNYEEIFEEKFEDNYEDIYELIWEINFEEFFDNYDHINSNKTYVIQGRLGLWDSKPCVYSNEIHYSLKEAITSLLDGDCILRVYEGKYGKLIVKISHHDGTDVFEIKELTKIGLNILEENPYYDRNICTRSGATKNVRFYKNL